MNKDLDERLVPQGEYRDALNVKVANSTGSDVGAIENALSNEAKSNLSLGSNAVCIGSISDDEDRVVYWFVKSDTGSFICYYDQKTNTSSILMSDTRLLTNQNPEKSVLNFSESHMIQANILTDADNLKKFIYFTDGLNPPRRINVATAKTYGVNGFDHEDINVIVKPPLFPPSLSLKKTDQDENNIEEKFLLFSYRYTYEDGEKSALSPFSKNAFLPSEFDYDFIGASNRAMENKFNQVDITCNSGSKLVKFIDIVFKESGNNNIYLAATIDKKKKGYADNTDFVYSFKNNNIYKVLAEDEIFRLYDNVPLSAKSQDIISNRLVYGNYIENFNLTDSEGEKINFDLSASYISRNIIESEPGEESSRSNIDYEIGVCYLDEYGRSTTVITSDNNSVYVKPINSIDKNTLVATINSKAPSFASYYRFYVKQSKVSDYHIISPVTIYQDGDSYWVRLEGDDKNKVSGKDYLIIKSDVRGVKKDVVKAKILDEAVKEKNFLEDSGYTGPILQESGYYIRISSVGGDFEEVNYERYRFSDSDNSGDSYEDNFIGKNIRYIEGPYMASGSGELNDLSVSGTYSNTLDKRFEVRIITTGSTDQFEWRSIVITTGTKSNWSSAINCSTSPILLQDGVSISFGAVTGHSSYTTWYINAKGDLSVDFSSLDDKRHSFITLQGLPTTDDKEEITSGTKMSFNYQEYKGKNSKVIGLQVNDVLRSSRDYANIEEWYWSEGEEQFSDLGFNVDENIRFRRGVYTSDSKSNNTFTITGLASDPLCLLIKSELYQISELGDNRAFSNAEIAITKKNTETEIVLETIPSENNSDVFYEVPGTYEIDDCGYHQGIKSEDTAQDFSNPAVLHLNFTNAFSFGNGFESYKIRDAFISNAISINNRPLTYLENYRQNNRNASITYSDVYEQSTNYNGLNEFNLSRVNYMDLDDEYGDIKRIHSRDTNLVVFQENKVSYLPYQKSILYNADGSGNLAQSINVFGNQVTYEGEYGISNSPHSFKSWSNKMYFADERRGVIMRLSQDGLTEISQYGMRDWFRDNVDAKNENVIIGGYDPFNGQYVLSIKNPVEEWLEDAFECLPASCDIKGVIYLAPPTTTTTTTIPPTTTTTTSSGITTTSTTTTTTTTQAPVVSFNIYANTSSGTNPLQGWSSATEACSSTGAPVTVYTSYGDSSVQEAYNNGHALYLDQALTTLYNGGNTYFKDSYSGGNSFQLGPSGFIFTFTSC